MMNYFFPSTARFFPGFGKEKLPQVGSFSGPVFFPRFGKEKLPQVGSFSGPVCMVGDFHQEPEVGFIPEVGPVARDGGVRLQQCTLHRQSARGLAQCH